MKGLNIILDKYILFLSHVKSVTLMMVESEQERLVLLFKRVINKLFRVAANIQFRNFRFKRGLKLV